MLCILIQNRIQTSAPSQKLAVRLRTNRNECLGLHRNRGAKIKEKTHVHVMTKGEVKVKILKGMIQGEKGEAFERQEGTMKQKKGEGKMEQKETERKEGWMERL